MGKRAPILGIAGLIFLVFGLLEHWMTLHPQADFWDFGWFSLIHVIAGLVCIVWFFASGTGSLTEFVRRRSTRYGTNALVYSIVFVVVVTMLNVFGLRYNKRWDLSSAGVNSLTDASKQVLDKLDGEVEILAFVGPQDKAFVEEVSKVYAYYTDKVKWRIVDPQVSPEVAQRENISTIPTLKIKSGDRVATVDRVEEEAITNGLHKVATEAQKKVYVLEGHGEPGIDDKQTATGMGLFGDTLRNQNYEVTKLFAAEAPIPDDAAALIVGTGDRSHFPAELEKIKTYLQKGGSVLFLLEPQRDPELVAFVRELGVRVGDDIILDQTMRLFEGVTIGTDAVVSQYGDHPSVKPLTERSLFSVARSVSPPVTEDRPGPIPFAPLAYTSSTSWAETDVDRVFSAGEAEREDNDIHGPVPVGAAGSANVAVLGGEGAKAFKVAVFGDTSFLTNAYLRQLYNDALGQSVVGWLAGEESLISIAPRVVRASRAYLGEEEARSVFYLSVLVLPELILLAGIIVWWRRSSL